MVHVAPPPPLQVMYRLCTALYPHLDISRLPDLIRQGEAEAKREADAWAEVMVEGLERLEADAAALEVARRRRLEAEAGREEERRLLEQERRLREEERRRRVEESRLREEERQRRVEAEEQLQVLRQQVQQQQQQLAAMGAGLPGSRQ